MGKEKYKKLQERFEDSRDELLDIKNDLDMVSVKDRMQTLEKLHRKRTNLTEKVNKKFQELVNYLTTQKRVSIERKITIRDEEVRKYKSRKGQLSLNRLMRKIHLIEKAITKGKKKKERIEVFKDLRDKLRVLNTNPTVEMELEEGLLRYDTSYRPKIKLNEDSKDKSFYAVRLGLDFSIVDTDMFKKWVRVRPKIDELLDRAEKLENECIKEHEKILNRIEEESVKYSVASNL